MYTHGKNRKTNVNGYQENVEIIFLNDGGLC